MTLMITIAAILLITALAGYLSTDKAWQEPNINHGPPKDVLIEFEEDIMWQRYWLEDIQEGYNPKNFNSQEIEHLKNLVKSSKELHSLILKGVIEIKTNERS